MPRSNTSSNRDANSIYSLILENTLGTDGNTQNGRFDDFGGGLLSSAEYSPSITLLGA